MIKTNKVLDTAGDGLWSDVTCGVLVTDVSLDVSEDAEYHRNELVVGFDPETWNTLVDGYIYTDGKFLRGVRKLLNELGLPGGGVSYSEQGMQGPNYVSFDVTDAFINAWFAKFSN
tara:strand:- start:753 stop:1100 length:348 start_codon:yes stop_codon:yes gene_type:complete